MRLILRAVAVALLGAVAGAAALVAVAGWHPAVTFETDRDLPSYASGFYPPERDGGNTFVWTEQHAEISLAGLDRRVPWTCEIRFRGARPSEGLMPDLMVAVDGLHAGAWHGTNEYQDVRVNVVPSPAKPGLVLSLTSTVVYDPGPADPRQLGVQVNRISCAPASGMILPPHRALGAASISAAILSAGFALIGVTAGSAVVAGLLMAVGQAWTLNSAGALYGPYPQTAIRLALVISVVMVLLVAALRWPRRPALRNTARFAVAFAAGALYLQLLALLHPAKSIVDAVFHAHRFEEVLAGRLYFTQLSTSATPFPYAIGLYLFSVPWAYFTANHVALLRIVVSSFEVLAGGLLYTMVVKTWGNRLAGSIAVALFILAPVSYVIIGNANLTNAFGQAVSIVTIAAVTVQAGRLRRPLVFVGVAALATLGLISHISTVLLLPSTLLVIAVLFWRFGGPPLRGAARPVVLVTAVALAASAAIYWGHFGNVYRIQFERMRAAVSASAPSPAPTAAADQAKAWSGDVSRLGRATIPLSARLRQAFDQTVSSIGWPIVLLALVGAWRTFAEGGRNRLDLVVEAWVLVWVVFVSASVLSPGNKAYQQDAYEFISRVLHATLPAAVLLAARAAAWGWRAGSAARAASVAALSWAVVVGVRAWSGWL